MWAWMERKREKNSEMGSEVRRDEGKEEEREGAGWGGGGGQSHDAIFLWVQQALALHVRTARQDQSKPGDGACAHYVIVHKFQWKPFWLATHLDPRNDWIGWQNCVNYDAFAQAPLCLTLGHKVVFCNLNHFLAVTEAKPKKIRDRILIRSYL